MGDLLDKGTFGSYRIEFYLESEFEIIAIDVDNMKKVGDYTFDLNDEDDPNDKNIYGGELHVEPAYRRKGIARRLHELANEHLGDFSLPNFPKTNADGMTEDGQGFYLKMLEENKLTDKQALQMRNFGNDDSDFN